jgi:hypothetical protein
MTDVLILKRIPGHRRGDITPLTSRMEQHIKAGNAKILPNAHEAWNGDSQESSPGLAASQVIGNEPADHDHVPDPTDDLGSDEELD